MKSLTMTARLGVLSIALFALAIALPTFAASYTFTVKGIVDVHAPTKNNVFVTGTYASNSDAIIDTLNENVPYSIPKATIQKYVKGKLVKTDYRSLKFGQEVVMFGSKVGSTFVVTRVVINDRSFSIVGTVQGVNHDASTFQVLVKTSSYKQSTLKEKTLTMHYTSSTKLWRSGKEIGGSDLTNDNQKIRVDGSISGTDNQYDAVSVWDKY